MALTQQNSKKQGDVGLGAAIAWFTSQGACVCIPLTDSQRYDLVVETSDGLKRVQVKTCTLRAPSGVYRVELRTKGGNRSRETVKLFSADDADLLFILTDEGCYLIPSDLVDQQNTINLGDKYEAYLL